jgi:WD40 repeat protein
MSIKLTNSRAYMIFAVLISTVFITGSPYYTNSYSEAEETIDNPIFRMPDITDFAKSPIQNTVAIRAIDGLTQLWNAETKKVELTFEGSAAGNLTWSPNGFLLAASCEQGACVWDTKTGELLHVLDGHPVHIVSEIVASSPYVRVADSLAFSPDGKILVTANLYDKAVILWNPATGEIIHTLFTQEFESGVYKIEFSADSSIFAVGTSFSASLWAVDNWEFIRTINAGNETMD